MQQLGKIINPHDLRGARLKRNSLTAGIVAAWNPNIFPGGNTLYDRAGVNNGTITGADWVADAKMGHCLDFAVDGDKVVIPDAADLDGMNDLTLMAWINVDSPGTYGRVFDKGNGASYILHVSGVVTVTELYFYISGAYISATTLPDMRGASHQVAGTYKRNTAGGWLIYLDGAIVKTANAPDTAVAAGANDLWIGNRSTGGRPFYGCIGQAFIFARALSAAEIAAIYADPYQIWDVGEEEWEWAKAPAAASGNPHYYYQMLSKRRAG